MFNVRLWDKNGIEQCSCKYMLFEQLTIYRTFPVDLFKKFPLDLHGEDDYLFILSS